MKEKVGTVFSIAEDNQPVSGCTISKEIYGGSNYIIYFSLAKNTDTKGPLSPGGQKTNSTATRLTGSNPQCWKL